MESKCKLNDYDFVAAFQVDRGKSFVCQSPLTPLWSRSSTLLLTTYRSFAPHLPLDPSMAYNDTSSLVARGFELHRSMLSASPPNDEAWIDYETAVGIVMAAGKLDPQAATTISVLADNVRSIASSRLTLENNLAHEVAVLSQKLQAIFLPVAIRESH